MGLGPCEGSDVEDSGEFLQSRDGSLTFRTAEGWAAGCSLPGRAARQQLRTMGVGGPVACFLDPPHAAPLRVALDRLGPTQAVLAIVLGPASLPVLLSCEDFSADLDAHRLWIVAGADWPARLRELFDRRPGLATPTQFVRLNLPDAARLDPVLAEAQRVFAGVTADRADRARAIGSGWRAPLTAGRLCVVTGRRFRLWDDAAVALADAVAAADGPTRLQPLNADDPLTASASAMLETAADCGALLTASIARVDVPELLPRELPWATWLTTPRVPSFAAAGPNDRLIVADPDWRRSAVAGGWPEDRVDVGGWPVVSPGHEGHPPGEPHVAIVSDTAPPDPPERLEEFSSHRLLWNAIRQELLDDPSAVGADPDAYLRARQRRFEIVDASLDRSLFAHGLIEPAIAQATAARLIRDRVPLRLHGEGWASLPAFAPYAAGPVTSRRQLNRAAAGAAALLDVRPVNWRNGLWSLNRPVVRCGGRPHQAIRHDVSLALSGRWHPEPATAPINLAALLDRLDRRS